MNQEEQSTTGKVISGYSKVAGYTNVFSSIVAFILGGLIILGGIFLGLLFSNFIVFLIFLGVGLLIIGIGIIGIKMSKRMREGKYYHVGRGWVRPK